MKGFLEWAAPWLGGSAATAFGLGRPDLGWIFAALTLSAMIWRAVLRDGNSVL